MLHVRVRAWRESPDVLEEYMAQSRRAGSGDSCGCAMGAKFMAPGLIAGAIWYGWQFHIGEISLGGAAVRVFAVTFVAMSVGKILGILWHRRRERRHKDVPRPV